MYYEENCNANKTTRQCCNIITHWDYINEKYIYICIKLTEHKNFYVTEI